jgi:hypothetical protein
MLAGLKYIAEPLIYNLSRNKVQFTVEYLEGYKTLSISQIADRTYQAGGKVMSSEARSLMYLISL